jgi:prepilin-type N-terminal cleavage/methylation domain-containing protein
MGIIRSRRFGVVNGFTLIELMVVISVIALLLSLLLPSLTQARFNTQVTLCATRLHQLDIALNAYVTDSKDWLPYEPTAMFWNEELLMQRQDVAGGLPNPGPVSMGRVYLGGYAREPKIWGCPATDYTYAPDRRLKLWNAAPLGGVLNTPTYVSDDGTGTIAVAHGWFYYGPITTGQFVAGTGDPTPYTKLSLRAPNWPVLSDPYFRTDMGYIVDVVAHAQQSINVCRNDGAIWRHANPLQVTVVTSWAVWGNSGYYPWNGVVHPWDGYNQGVAAIAP